MGIAALSINPALYTDSLEKEVINQKFIDDLFWLTFYHQHLGQEYGGLATLREDKEDPFLLRTHRGHFRDNFENDLRGFQAPLGIGHISGGFREPYKIIESSLGAFVICFAGNLFNKDKLIADLIAKKHGLERIDDVFLISQLILQADYDHSQKADENLILGLTYMTEKIEGAYALAILTPQKIYAVRGPDAHESLTLAKKKGAVAAVSESNSLFNQGFQIVRELEPGEVISLEKHFFYEIGRVKTEKKVIAQPCSFKWIYTSDPATIINGLTAAEARCRLGAKHAQRDIAKGFIPHFILPVPDSGRFHAIGYKREFDRQLNRGKISQIPYYDENLEKYSYSGRSYTPPDQVRRDLEAQKKIIPIIKDLKIELIEHDDKHMKLYIEDRIFDAAIHNGECLIEIDVVLLDDSIVRGTQTVNNLIPKLKVVFEKAISQITDKLRPVVKVIIRLNVHLRIGNPKLVSTCDWGKSNKEQDNLAAVDGETGRIRSAEEIAGRLGVASCYFNNTEDVSEVIGIPLKSLCVDCDIAKEN